MEILSGEMNFGLCREMDSLLSMMHAQINRAIGSAINDRVIPEIQSIFNNLPLREKDAGTGTSTCHKGLGPARWVRK